MREHPLRLLLTRLRAIRKESKVELVYLHRGAPDDQARITVSSISRIGRGWFMLEDGETQIPFHRVLSVTDPESGQILWEKRRPGGSSTRRP